MSNQGGAWRRSDRQDAGLLSVILAKGQVSIAIVLPRDLTPSANPAEDQASVRALLREAADGEWQDS